MKSQTILLLLLFTATTVFSQKDSLATKTIKGTVNKMLEVISGEIGEPRDWDAYRDLFLPGAQKVILNPNAKHPANKAKVVNLEEFVRYFGSYYAKDGFLEVEIGLTVNEFNGIANVFQAYHAKNLKGTYDKKGINSYQLVFHSDRWWIASTTWSAESENHKIPSEFLTQ